MVADGVPTISPPRPWYGISSSRCEAIEIWNVWKKFFQGPTFGVFNMFFVNIVTPYGFTCRRHLRIMAKWNKGFKTIDLSNGFSWGIGHQPCWDMLSDTRSWSLRSRPKAVHRSAKSAEKTPRSHASFTIIYNHYEIITRYLDFTQNALCYVLWSRIWIQTSRLLTLSKSILESKDGHSDLGEAFSSSRDATATCEVEKWEWN